LLLPRFNLAEAVTESSRFTKSLDWVFRPLLEIYGSVAQAAQAGTSDLVSRFYLPYTYVWYASLSTCSVMLNEIRRLWNMAIAVR